MRAHRPALIVASCVLLARPVAAQSRPRLSVSPARPEFGALVRVYVHDAGDASDVTPTGGTMGGEPLHFSRDSAGRWWAIGAIPLEASDSVVVTAYLGRGDSTSDTIRTTVHVPHQIASTGGGRPRRARRLRVDPRFARTDAAVEARVADENARARAIGRASHATPRLWTAPFLRPRSSRITSGFGSGRVFNGRVASSHGGVDFAGHVGDPVRAANRGVVALVDTFFLAGRVIYIDHGGGVVTGYFHLSQAEVAAGDTVERGQEIGRVGATGRVTGPHLHWSARYGALTVDPLDLFTVSGAKSEKPSRPKRRVRKRARRHSAR